MGFQYTWYGLVAKLQVRCLVLLSCVGVCISELSSCSTTLAKVGNIKTHASVRRICLFVTKTLTWLIFSAVLMIEHWYLACMILVTSLINCHHAVTLTFDLLQGQISCRAGHHNSLYLLVTITVTLMLKITFWTLMPLGVHQHILFQISSIGYTWSIQCGSTVPLYNYLFDRMKKSLHCVIQWLLSYAAFQKRMWVLHKEIALHI